ncbi:hypothetical protein HME9302_00888 [Alteripontixanthobacter maritimus]|uniref:Uncharacterized protein n=1 Tax=Alteripontixanthobacter maritimus TaxID=2161824 RepID=A0A369Q953_9SPHN|nr:hypothetical protein HME9302_00888 [Alteripontixanthobacter maritimus]
MDHRKLDKRQRLKRDMFFYVLGTIVLVVGLAVVLPRM